MAITNEENAPWKMSRSAVIILKNNVPKKHSTKHCWIDCRSPSESESALLLLELASVGKCPEGVGKLS